MKRCSRCGLEKPAEAFSAHARERDGLQPWCKACRAEHDREQREVLVAPLLEFQGGSCATCPARDAGHSKGWTIDHDHTCPTHRPTRETGKGMVMRAALKARCKCVRGVLCHRCNVNFGRIEKHLSAVIAPVYRSYLDDPPAQRYFASLRESA